MSKGWDNATLKKLKALTGKGLSTSEIGKRLGMSKNAVVGKLNRLGWNSKATTEAAPVSKVVKPKKTEAKPVLEKVKKTTAVQSSAKKSPAKKDVSAKAPKAAAKPATKKEVVSAKEDVRPSKASTKNLAMHQRIIQHSLGMANLKPCQCRFPIGDPDSENFHFCGEQVFVGKPYCYEHCKQAYQFTPLKKK